MNEIFGMTRGEYCLLENDLIGKAKDGNRWAMEKLLGENYHIIYGYLLKLSINEDVAKDITQEVMVKAITNIRSFKGDSKFSTWLVSIASNLYKDCLKKNRSIPTEMEDLNLISSQNTEDEVIQREHIRQLKKSLLELPESQRKVFILKHYFSYTYDEIAKILGCPVGTVRSKLHYSILKLKSIMNGGA